VSVCNSTTRSQTLVKNPHSRVQSSPTLSQFPFAMRFYQDFSFSLKNKNCWAASGPATHQGRQSKKNQRERENTNVSFAGQNKISKERKRERETTTAVAATGHDVAHRERKKERKKGPPIVFGIDLFRTRLNRFCPFATHTGRERQEAKDGLTD